MKGQEKLEAIINQSKYLVFFGGAGVSTESGLPDFRSKDGLYNQRYKYPPEEILSHTFFVRKPEIFFEFCRDRINIEGILPNRAHRKLAELEKQGILKAVVTQNIDGLHQLAGSKNVLELHGSMKRSYCAFCEKKYGMEYFDSKEAVPHCKCGGIVRPDIVLYEEPLKEDVLNRSIEAISHADTLIVGGTSLAVYPAAGLLEYFQGKNLVLINRDATSFDSDATLIIRDNIARALDF